ncbi:MAG: hypothetical protein AVDCRST_MAG89-61, partial [uncultured Gemmatimonadetes bacterium]
ALRSRSRPPPLCPTRRRAGRRLPRPASPRAGEAGPGAPRGGRHAHHRLPGDGAGAHLRAHVGDGDREAPLPAGDGVAHRLEPRHGARGGDRRARGAPVRARGSRTTLARQHRLLGHGDRLRPGRSGDAPALRLHRDPKSAGGGERGALPLLQRRQPLHSPSQRAGRAHPGAEDRRAPRRSAPHQRLLLAGFGDARRGARGLPPEPPLQQHEAGRQRHRSRGGRGAGLRGDRLWAVGPSLVAAAQRVRARRGALLRTPLSPLVRAHLRGLPGDGRHAGRRPHPPERARRRGRHAAAVPQGNHGQHQPQQRRAERLELGGRVGPAGCPHGGRRHREERQRGGRQHRRAEVRPGAGPEPRPGYGPGERPRLSVRDLRREGGRRQRAGAAHPRRPGARPADDPLEHRPARRAAAEHGDDPLQPRGGALAGRAGQPAAGARGAARRAARGDDGGDRRSPRRDPLHGHAAHRGGGVPRAGGGGGGRAALLARQLRQRPPAGARRERLLPRDGRRAAPVARGHAAPALGRAPLRRAPEGRACPHRREPARRVRRRLRRARERAGRDARPGGRHPPPPRRPRRRPRAPAHPRRAGASRRDGRRHLWAPAPAAGRGGADRGRCGLRRVAGGGHGLRGGAGAAPLADRRRNHRARPRRRLHARRDALARPRRAHPRRPHDAPLPLWRRRLGRRQRRPFGRASAARRRPGRVAPRQPGA